MQSREENLDSGKAMSADEEEQSWQDFFFSLREEMSEFWSARKRKAELKNKNATRINFEMYCSLADYDRDKKNRYAVDLQPIPDAYFADVASSSNSENQEASKAVKIEKFMDYYELFAHDESYYGCFNDVQKTKESLQKLCANLDKLSDREYEYFSETELSNFHACRNARKALIASEGEKKGVYNHQAFMEFKAAYKVAQDIINTRERYRLMIQQLNGSIFSTLKKSHSDVGAIEKQWHARRQFAHLPSPALLKLAEGAIEQLRTLYSSIGIVRMNLEKESEQKKVLQAVEALMNSTREKIAQAMLQRLKLSLQYEASDDDVVVATLQELTQFGLRQNYVDEFAKTSFCTLSNELVLEFNFFITQFGSTDQKNELAQLYGDVGSVPIPHAGNYRPADQDVAISLYEFNSTDSLVNMQKSFILLAPPMAIPIALDDGVMTISPDVSHLAQSKQWELILSKNLERSGFVTINPTTEETELNELAKNYFGHVLNRYAYVEKVHRMADEFTQDEACRTAYNILACELIQKKAEKIQKKYLFPYDELFCHLASQLEERFFSLVNKDGQFELFVIEGAMARVEAIKKTIDAELDTMQEDAEYFRKEVHRQLMLDPHLVDNGPANIINLVNEKIASKNRFVNLLTVERDHLNTLLQPADPDKGIKNKFHHDLMRCMVNARQRNNTELFDRQYKIIKKLIKEKDQVLSVSSRWYSSKSRTREIVNELNAAILAIANCETVDAVLQQNKAILGNRKMVQGQTFFGCLVPNSRKDKLHRKMENANKVVLT